MGSPALALPASSPSSLLAPFRSHSFPFSSFNTPGSLGLCSLSEHPSPNSCLDIFYSSFRFQLKCHLLNDIEIDPLLCASSSLHFSFTTLIAICSFIFIVVTICLMGMVASRGKGPRGQRACSVDHCMSRPKAVLDSRFRNGSTKASAHHIQFCCG